MSMRYSTFHPHHADPLRQPLFLGAPVNVARYDQQRYPVFEKLIEKQLSFFWRPEEVDLSRDRIDFASLSDAERHIFLSNLKYQSLLDSIQGRSPNVAFLPLVSLPELETWIETWAFSETIHSRSYTHIIRNIVNDPALIFDDITRNEAILRRAADIARHYDEVIAATRRFDDEPSDANRLALKTSLYLCVMSVNVLEAVRFYVSFACAFAFAERKLMEGNAKIIRLIARDEALHLSGTQHLLNIMAQGDDDPEFAQIARDQREAARDLFAQAAEQEKRWAQFLFKDGPMVGLNTDVLCRYVEYITNARMSAIGLEPLFADAKRNPIPWINSWLASDTVQVAPQEVEVSSYLVGQVDADLSREEFGGFQL